METEDARKKKFADEELISFLENFQSIAAAYAKNYEVFSLEEKGMDAALKRVKGPSGNLRAPALRLGDTLIVGFNEKMYDQFF